MIRVALLSKWHVHAADYARQASQHPRLEIVAVWDEILERGEDWAGELGVSFEADLTKLLKRDDIDAVIVDTPTDKHKEVISMAARAGKHIFTEKVLAFTEADCVEIFEEIEKANVQFMISLPRLSDPYYLYAQEAVEKGWLGQLTTLRCRLAHNGAVPFPDHPNGWLPQHFFDREQCGGGALIDLGAHPIYITNRLGGRATAVTARLSSFLGHQVDDNSVVIVEYESGALGIIEAGFVSGKSPFMIELHGTEGSLIVEGEKVRIQSSRLEGEGWLSPELPEACLSPMEQWVKAIEESHSPAITKEDALALSKINEWAAKSHQEGKRIQTPVS